MRPNARVAAHKMMPPSASTTVVKKRPYAEEYGDVDAGQVDRLSGSHV